MQQPRLHARVQDYSVTDPHDDSHGWHKVSVVRNGRSCVRGLPETELEVLAGQGVRKRYAHNERTVTKSCSHVLCSVHLAGLTHQCGDQVPGGVAGPLRVAALVSDLATDRQNAVRGRHSGAAQRRSGGRGGARCTPGIAIGV
jgi:hypothetical protein